MQLRDEARAAVVAADATVQAAAARAQVAEETLSATTIELRTVREKLNSAHAEAARAQGEVATLCSVRSTPIRRNAGRCGKR